MQIPACDGPRARPRCLAALLFATGSACVETRRMENPQGRFTLVFLAAPENPEAEVELT